MDIYLFDFKDLDLKYYDIENFYFGNNFDIVLEEENIEFNFYNLKINFIEEKINIKKKLTKFNFIY